MRLPDFDLDGWSLEDGEEYHRAAPATFWIPTQSKRESLQPGDFAKLVFKICVGNPGKPAAYERMWVIVRERINGKYLGRLDNQPSSLAENDRFWCGVEVPFEARHIIDIDRGDAGSIALAAEPPLRSWH